ncbi:hypothetical protein TRFO_14663 [Tritrichomonas foetus]|uniref:Uncharacterized protein n=1 Tax=Tritrichomonas foetus TaxID=1144522 RepID=A0A1J4KVG0_9EUKA|nr:hypothetical protein TRFO_14663 [Tritrichomonas foetus]|eukprot:OHT14880.1 hypothetical protein TRFO_14663 [Tritrichomonas foetus]
MIQSNNYPNIDISDIYFTFKFPQTTPLIDILNKEIRFRQLRPNTRSFSEYLLNNASHLVEYALLDVHGDIGKKSFILVSGGDEDLMKTIILKNLLFSRSEPILNNIVVPKIVVDRIAIIYTTLLQKIGDILPVEILPFFMSLIKFLDDSAVFGFFHNLCSKSERIEKLQKGIPNTDFQSYLLDALERAARRREISLLGNSQKEREENLDSCVESINDENGNDFDKADNFKNKDFEEAQNQAQEITTPIDRNSEILENEKHQENEIKYENSHTENEYSNIENDNSYNESENSHTESGNSNIESENSSKNSEIDQTLTNEREKENSLPVFYPKLKHIKIDENYQEIIKTVDLESNYINPTCIETIDQEKLINVLSLLRDCLKNPHLEKLFTTKNTLDALENLTNYPFHENDTSLIVYNYIWRTISSFCSISTIEYLGGVLKKVMSTLILPFEQLHMFHIFQIDLIAKITLLNPSMISTNDKGYICEIILKLLVMFPNSSNLISSIFRIIRSALRDEEFKRIALFDLMPFIVILGKQNLKNASSANSLLLLQELEKSRKTDKEIDAYLAKSESYNMFYKDFFKNYLDTVDKPYGGKISIFGL